MVLRERPGASPQQVDFARGGVVAGSVSPEHPEPHVNRASLSTQPGPPSGTDTRGAFHRPPHRGDQPEKPHTLISAVQSRVSAGATGGQGLRRPQGPGNDLVAPVPSLRTRETAIREPRFSFFLFDAISEHPPLSLPKAPTRPRNPGRLPHGCRCSALHKPVPALTLRSSPGFLSHIYFCRGSSDLWFRNDLSSAGHEGKERIPGLTHQAVICTFPCQTRGHFKMSTCAEEARENSGPACGRGE